MPTPHALAAAAVALISGLPSQAGVIFSQPIGTPVSLLYSDYNLKQLVADDFVLAGPLTTITSVGWWGYYQVDNGGPTDNISLRFYADASGYPALAPFSDQTPSSVTTTATGYTYSGSSIVKYTADLPTPLALTAGAPYYLSIVDPDDADWFVWACGGPGDQWFKSGLTSGVNPDTLNWVHGFEFPAKALTMAFELSAVAAVPEPGSLAVLSLGLLGFLRRRRRAA